MAQSRTAARRPVAAASDRKPALVLAFVFGVVFLAALLAIAVAIPNPTPSQFETFRIIIALAAGGVAAVIPGLLDLRIKQGTRLAIRASGALAVFVAVYFYSPARWIADTTPAVGEKIDQRTVGDCSPAIAGAGNINLDCSPTGKVKAP
jgi:uncharacterized membrane protein YbhN (UPF0104 family)